MQVIVGQRSIILSARSISRTKNMRVAYTIKNSVAARMDDWFGALSYGFWNLRGDTYYPPYAILWQSYHVTAANIIL